MVRSPRFGSISCYSIALFRLGFPVAPGINPLTSQHKITRRLILQQARYHPINRALARCKLTVLGSISLSFSLFFSPFHHCTRSLSVTSEYLALPDGPGRFRQDSSCPALLRIPLCFVSLRIPGYHRLRPNFPDRSPHEMSCNVAVLQPRIRRNGYGLGSSPFARHYWGNHCLFSFPAGTKMFQFPALASCQAG